MLRSLVGSEMCIRDRYQRRVRGWLQVAMSGALSGAQAHSPLLSQLRLVIAKAVWSACITTGHSEQNQVGLSGDTPAAANRWFGLHGRIQLTGPTKGLVLEELRQHRLMDRRTGLELEGPVTPLELVEALSRPNTMAMLLSSQSLSLSPSPARTRNPPRTTQPEPVPHVPQSVHQPHPSPDLASPPTGEIKQQLKSLTLARRELSELRVGKHTTGARGLAMAMNRIKMGRLQRVVRLWHFHKCWSNWSGVLDWVAIRSLTELVGKWQRQSMARCLHSWYLSRAVGIAHHARSPHLLQQLENKLRHLRRDCGARLLANHVYAMVLSQRPRAAIVGWRLSYARACGPRVELAVVQAGLRIMAQLLCSWRSSAQRRCCHAWRDLWLTASIKKQEMVPLQAMAARCRTVRWLSIHLLFGVMTRNWARQSMTRCVHSWATGTLQAEHEQRAFSLATRHSELVGKKGAVLSRVTGLRNLWALRWQADVQDTIHALLGWSYAVKLDTYARESRSLLLENSELARSGTRVAALEQELAVAGQRAAGALKERNETLSALTDQLVQARIRLESTESDLSESQAVLIQTRAQFSELGSKYTLQSEHLDHVTLARDEAREELACTAVALQRCQDVASADATQLAELKQRLTEFDTRAKDSDAKLGNMTEHAAELVRARDIKVTAVESHLALAELELADMETGLDSATTDISVMQLELDRQSLRCQELEATNEKLEAELNSCQRAQTESNDARVAELESKLADSKEVATHFLAQFSEKEEELHEVQDKFSAAMSNAEMDLAMMEAELEALQDFSDKTSKKLANSHEWIGDLEKKVSDGRRRIAIAATQADEADKARDQATGELTITQARLTTALKDLGVANHDLGLTKDQLQTVTEELAQVRRGAEETAWVAAELDESTQMQELENKLDQATSTRTIARLEQQVLGLKQELDLSNQEANRLQIALDQATNNLARLQAEFKSSEQNLLRVECDLGETQTALAQAVNDSAQMQESHAQSITALEAELATMLQNWQSLKMTNASAEHQLQDSNLQATRLEQSLADASQKGRGAGVHKMAGVLTRWRWDAMRSGIRVWRGDMVTETSFESQHQAKQLCLRLLTRTVVRWLHRSLSDALTNWAGACTKSAAVRSVAAMHQLKVDQLAEQADSERRMLGCKLVLEEKSSRDVHLKTGIRLAARTLYKWQHQSVIRCTNSWCINTAADKAATKLKKRKKASAKMESQLEKLQAELKKSEKQHMGQMVQIHSQMNEKMNQAIANKDKQFGIKMFKSVMMSEGRMVLVRCFQNWRTASSA
eukprot:TRINITY_DN19198_c0_g2_i1.p1 TRINITY_DN19198_c0_g2~~TRINITY_DN19198_c0_g2_i1.p1  ORF type:complete len:1328 (-),score=290.52 TRINITY_DN19198_c0_g2_i1:130-4023(-)